MSRRYRVTVIDSEDRADGIKVGDILTRHEHLSKDSIRNIPEGAVIMEYKNSPSGRLMWKIQLEEVTDEVND